ncbi:MAG TPA: diacylglycerol kinase family protein [Candidatus Paceibacterota bacterium]
MLKKHISSFRFAWNGLKTVWREEHNFRVEVLVAVIVVFSIFYFGFSFFESALCVLAITLVLCAEIINTVVEDLCDKVQLNPDPIIAKIKDTAGAFVLVSVLGSIVVGLLVFYNHFF